MNLPAFQRFSENIEPKISITIKRNIWFVDAKIEWRGYIAEGSATCLAFKGELPNKKQYAKALNAAKEQCRKDLEQHLINLYSEVIEIRETYDTQD